MTSVRLRRANEDDIERRQKLGFHPDIQAGYGIRLSEWQPMSLAQAEAWFAEIKNDPLAWTIYADRRLAGLVRLHRVNEADKRCFLAVGLVDGERMGQGIGTEAIMRCLHHAFHELGMHRVALRVLENNTRAIQCYEKCGFKREGVERESAKTDFGWQNDVIMGVLKTEFDSLDWKSPAQHAKEWQEVNADAFKALNEDIERHGIWYDGYRTW